MDLVNDIRPSYAQNVIVAFQWPGVTFKFLTSEVLFTQLVPLDHGPQASIQHHDSLLQNGFNPIRQGFRHACFQESEKFDFKKRQGKRMCGEGV